MSEKGQDELNKKNTRKHTWIGDPDEVRPDQRQRNVEKIAGTVPESDERTTILVERKRKAYRGFITDEEVKASEEQAEAMRKAREASRASWTQPAETRIYTGIGSGMNENRAEEKPAAEGPPAKPPAEPKPPRKKKVYRFDMSDDRKFRRFKVLIAVFLIALAFDLCFVFLKYSASGLPDKTAALKEQTSELNKENEKLRSDAEKLGDYDQIKELRDSWQRIKDQLDE